MSDLVKIDKSTITALENASKNAKALQLVGGDSLATCFKVAEAMALIDDALNMKGVKEHFMQLQGVATGFLADKPYDWSQVKNALKEGIMNGVLPINNQMNIIAGRCYITKNGFKYKLDNLDGLEYSVIPGVPISNEKRTGCTLKVKVTWKNGKKSGEEELEFGMKTDSYSTVDNLQGKATRKARAWLWDRLGGKGVPEGDIEDTDAITVEGKDITNSPKHTPLLAETESEEEPKPKREPEPEPEFKKKEPKKVEEEPPEETKVQEEEPKPKPNLTPLQLFESIKEKVTETDDMVIKGKQTVDACVLEISEEDVTSFLLKKGLIETSEKFEDCEAPQLDSIGKQYEIFIKKCIESHRNPEE